MVVFLIISRLLDRGYSLANTIAASAFIILLADPTAVEDSSFQMTFAAVLAVVGLGMPASQWAFGWLSEALKDFNDTEKDSELPVEVADWRVSCRTWCERHGLPAWLITHPWKIALVIGESLLISLCVEAVFIIFMVESFHRLSPVSPFINVPAGMVAAMVTPLGLLLIFLPAPISTMVGWIIEKLLAALLKILDFTLRIPGATFRVPSPPVWIWLLYGVFLAILLLSVRKKWTAACLASVIGILGLQAAIVLKDFSPAPPQSVKLFTMLLLLSYGISRSWDNIQS